jgi:hypothetical protein
MNFVICGGPEAGPTRIPRDDQNRHDGHVAPERSLSLISFPLEGVLALEPHPKPCFALSYFLLDRVLMFCLGWPVFSVLLPMPPT